MLVSSSHSVGESNLHLQFTPSYRRDVFRNSVLREVLTSLLLEQAKKLRVSLAALDYGPDHVHLFLKYWNNWSVPDLAQRLKGVASRVLRRDYSYLFSDKLFGRKVLEWRLLLQNRRRSHSRDCEAIRGRESKQTLDHTRRFTTLPVKLLIKCSGLQLEVV